MYKVFKLGAFLITTTLLQAMEEVRLLPEVNFKQASSGRKTRSDEKTNKQDQRIIEFIKTGDSKILEKALSDGVNINTIAEDGNTALHLAVETGLPQRVETLLAKGADIRLSNALGKAPLHIASQMGFVGIVKVLLAQGADPDATYNSHETSLELACLHSHIDVVKLLLEKKKATHKKAEQADKALPLFQKERIPKKDKQEVSFQDPTPMLSPQMQQVMEKLINKRGEVAATFFSPKDDVRSLLLALINAENKRVRIAVYSFTDKKIAQAVIAAHQRGVSIECIVDKGNTEDAGSKISQLTQANIPLFIYQNNGDEKFAPLMHNKFALFDSTLDNRAIIWTGSYNFTKAASERNQENVVILDDNSVVQRFSKQFEQLKKLTLSRDKEEAIDHGFSFDARAGEEERKLQAKAKKNAHKAIFEENVAARALAIKILQNKIIESAERGDAQALLEILSSLSLPQKAHTSLTLKQTWTMSPSFHRDFIWSGDESRDRMHKTAFHVAALNGHAKSIEVLLDYFDSISEVGNNLLFTIDKHSGREEVWERTPHSLAAEHNHLEALKMLCSEKWVKVMGDSCIKEEPQVDCSSLGKILATQHLRIDTRVKYIDLAGQRKRTPLHWATINGHIDIVKFLLSRGVDLHVVDIYGCTSFHYATMIGYKEIAALLVAHGAHTHGQEKASCDMLSEAVFDGNIPVTLSLLENGAPINSIARGMPLKNSMLHIAVERGHEALVSCLLAKGAHIEAVNAWGRTPLHCAGLRITELLLDHGAAINAKDKNGETALHIASSCGNSSLVELLLMRGADRSVINYKGATPLKLAEERMRELKFAEEQRRAIEKFEKQNEEGLNKSSFTMNEPAKGVKKSKAYLLK